MLRIVTQLAEAEAELRRISERTQADQNCTAKQLCGRSCKRYAVRGIGPC